MDRLEPCVCMYSTHVRSRTLRVVIAMGDACGSVGAYTSVTHPTACPTHPLV